MKVTFLGTGTSQGVPVIACECPVCRSSDPRDKRLRTSVLVEGKNTTVVIDTGPDFRCQMLRAGVRKLDAIVLTHEHKDHLAGMDDVRAFNFRQQKGMDVYATSRVQETVVREFAYVFSSVQYPGVPRLNLIEIQNEPFRIGGLTFLPVEVMHYKLPVFGFRIGPFAYITDAKTIADEEIEKIKGADVLVLNALQQEAHVSHFTLDEAVALSETVGAKQTYLTHIGHKMGKHANVETQLPRGVDLAYDQLVLEI